MIKNIIIEGLKYALEGVSELDQNIFENYRMREEVENNVTTTKDNNETRGCEEGCDRPSVINAEDDGNAGSENERANSEREQEEEVSCNATQGRLQYRRDVQVQVLTNDGKRFVNNMLDGYYSEKANDRDFDNRYGIGEFPYPNLNLFRLINVTRRNFYNAEAEILDGTKSAYLIEYPQHKELVDIDFELIDDEPEFMDPEEFERTWKRIIRVSPRIDSSVQVNTNITNPVKYWNDIKCAYDVLGMAVKYGETPTYDEYMFAKLMQPKWRINPDAFTRIETKVPRTNKADIMEWLFKAPNSNNNSTEKKKKNSNNNSSRRNNWNANRDKNKKANNNNPNTNKEYQAEQSSDDKKQHDN